MRALPALLLIASAGATLAQGAGAPSSPATPAPSGSPAASPPPAEATPAPASSPARPTSGRSVTPGLRQPAKADAPTKEQTLDAQAKKARDEQEKRMKERDRQMERAMRSICKGC